MRRSWGHLEIFSFSHLIIPISLHDIPSSWGSWEHSLGVCHPSCQTQRVQIPRAALRITEPISSINLVQQILRDRYKFQFNSNPAQNSTQHNPHDVKLDVKRSILKTSLAQRQSAGLITPRSADQNPQEVFSHSPALQKRVVIAQATLNLSNT